MGFSWSEAQTNIHASQRSCHAEQACFCQSFAGKMLSCLSLCLQCKHFRIVRVQLAPIQLLLHFPSLPWGEHSLHVSRCYGMLGWFGSLLLFFMACWACQQAAALYKIATLNGSQRTIIAIQTTRRTNGKTYLSQIRWRRINWLLATCLCLCSSSNFL